MLALALAVVTWVAWEWRKHFVVTGFLHDWGPNIGTDLLFLAIGVLVFERALSKRIESQQKPRHDQALYSIMWLLYELEDFVESVYRVSSRLPPYSEINVVIDRWRRDLLQPDTPRLDNARYREVIRASTTFSTRAAVITANNQDVLPAALVASIDELAGVAREAEQWFADPTGYEPPKWIEVSKSAFNWPRSSDPVRAGHDGAMFVLLGALERVSTAFRTSRD
jgi:hypothetical protein